MGDADRDRVRFAAQSSEGVLQVDIQWHREDESRKLRRVIHSLSGLTDLAQYAGASTFSTTTTAIDGLVLPRVVCGEGVLGRLPARVLGVYFSPDDHICPICKAEVVDAA